MLRKFRLEDYEEVVNMLYSMYVDMYGDEIGYKYSFYMYVNEWISKGHDIIIGMKDDMIAGFSHSFINRNDGLSAPKYYCEVLYIKPEHRRGKVTYMLYDNVVKVASELGMKPVVCSRLDNGADKIVSKHFDTKNTFTIQEGV